MTTQFNLQNFAAAMADNLDSWEWKTGSILYNVDETTPCKEIHQAFCNEIGRFYEAKCFKYSPSGRKLEFKIGEYKIKIFFSSSYSNSRSDYVWFEMNTGIYPDKLEKQYKLAKATMHPAVFFNSGIFERMLIDREQGTVVVRQIFKEDTEFVRDGFEYAEERYNNGCNIYKVDIVRFRKVIKYLNNVITTSFNLAFDPNALIVHIESFYSGSQLLCDKRFHDYLDLYYSKDSDVYRAFCKKYKEILGSDLLEIDKSS